MTSEDTESALGHLNLIEFARPNARCARNHTVVDKAGALLFAGDTDWPAYNNGVLRTDDRAAAVDVLDRARAFFHARDRGYSLWARRLETDADLARAAERTGPDG